MQGVVFFCLVVVVCFRGKQPLCSFFVLMTAECFVAQCCTMLSIFWSSIGDRASRVRSSA